LSDPRELDPARFRVRALSPRGFRQVTVDEGGGQPLLLVHGWPETKRIWWRNVAPLAAAGFRVIAPDLRGFGESDVAPDGFADVASHSRDLAALLDSLGVDRVVLVGGDLGGAVIQDFSLRFPERVERLAIFNSPLPYLKDRMTGMRTRPAAEASDYFLRQGTDADALARELDTDERRRRYVAAFYGPRFWAHPGTFTREAAAFMAEPFGDAAKLRSGFAGYESVFDPSKRSEPPLLRENPTHALILFGPSDHVIYPEFDRMAAAVFPDHVGPFLVRDAGHFLQWEAADVLNGALCAFCRDLSKR
jgi:pimeloyl-ACP methyl ester carboxylesterase